MKRNIILFTLLVAFAFTACSQKEQLFIYNWTYYTPDSVIEQFEKEFNVKVVYDQFASN